MRRVVSPVYSRVKRKSSKTVTEYCFTVREGGESVTHKFIDEANARAERDRVKGGGHRDLVPLAAKENIIDQLGELVAAAAKETN